MELAGAQHQGYLDTSSPAATVSGHLSDRVDPDQAFPPPLPHRSIAALAIRFDANTSRDLTYAFTVVLRQTR
jgi:hypothetical protein